MPRKSAMFWKVRAMPSLVRVGRGELRDVRPVEVDAAALGAVDPGDAVEQAGLAGAVRADDGVDRAASDLEADVGEGGDAPEVEYQVVDPQERHRITLDPR